MQVSMGNANLKKWLLSDDIPATSTKGNATKLIFIYCMKNFKTRKCTKSDNYCMTIKRKWEGRPYL